ncbi:WGR domain-containing protein [Candidatus Woesearchaeota archaeon]|nr:WGR domain-containing protein [Candidatus Woesearchaeota archaeon]
MVTAYKLYDPSCPKFPDSYNVVDQVVMNFTNIGGNNNKFYVMELQKSNGTLRIFTHYGRVGAEGTKEGRFFNNPEDAEKEFERLQKAKQRKGYVPVDVVKASVGSGKIKNGLPKPKPSKACSLDERVQDFVTQIYTEASKSLEDTIMTPLGALSESQIKKGCDKLEEIRKALGCKNKNVLTGLSSDFYTLIPQRFYGRIDDSVVIDSSEKADRQEELLQLMKDVYNVKDNLGSEIMQKYQAINALVQPLESSESEYKRIAKKVASTQSSHHKVELYVRNIFRIGLNSTKGRYNPKRLEQMELFHGSANRNILGILQRGLLIAPPCAQHTGAAFGRGIYFARHSTKSAQYSTKFYQNIGSNGFLFIADVALGNMQKVKNFSWGKKLPQQGYDSVMGVKGADLIHDEFIVYNPNQVELRYVIDFEPRKPKKKWRFF